MLYFAYGSNLDPVQMAERCPGSRFVAVARLPGHRLAFTRFSEKRRGGVADVVPDPAHDVWGVLWDLDDAHVAALDGFEGYVPGGTRNAYERTSATVESAQGFVEAAVYRANPQPDPPLPHASYVKHLIDGARAHGLPTEYQQALQEIPVQG